MILDGCHPAEDAPESLFIACGKANESSGTSGVTAHRVAVEQSRPVENRRQYQIATRDPSKTSGGSGSEPALPQLVAARSTLRPPRQEHHRVAQRPPAPTSRARSHAYGA